MFIEVNNFFQVESFYGMALSRRFPKPTEFYGESHDFWEIEYVDNGNLVISEDDKTYNMTSGDIIFHAPMEYHSTTNLTSVPAMLYNVSFKLSGSPPPELKEGVFNLTPQMREEFRNWYQRAHLFIYGLDTSEYAGLQNASWLTNFILTLCRSQKAKKRTSASVGLKEYKKISTTMQANLYNNSSIQDIAKTCFISVSYMKKLFSEYSDTTPKKYYSSLQIREAQHLIVNNMSIADIAEKLSFSSPNYFSRFFKKHTGVSPLQYKKIQSVTKKEQ